MYTGYFCIKCQNIPLIQLIPEENPDNIKVLVKCKCGKKFLSLQDATRNYYKENIKQNNILNDKLLEDIEELIKEKERGKNEEKENKSIEKIEEEFNRIVNNNKEIIENIKNKLIEILNEKIKEIESIYQENIKRNKKLIEFYNTLFSSYKKDKDIFSNKENILINFSYFNEIKPNSIKYLIYDKVFDNSLKSLKDYLNSHLIIKKKELKSNLLKEVSLGRYEGSNKFFKLSNEIGVSLGRNSNCIYVYSLNKFNCLLKIKFDLYIYDFCVNKNGNIIILDNNKTVKILPELPYEEINKLQNEKIENRDNSIKEKKFEPLLQFQTEEQMIKIISIDNINSFITYNKGEIFLYEYDLENKNFILKNTFKLNDDKNKNTIYKILPLKNSFNTIDKLLIFTFCKYLVIKADDLSLINEEKLEKIKSEKFNVIQINGKEIALSVGGLIQIINFERNQINISKKTNLDINYIGKLNDGSLIVGQEENAFRFSQKLEKISKFHQNDFHQDDDEEGGFYTYYNIKSMYHLSQRKVVLYLNCGDIELYDLVI